ncbi:MAG: hypothetical protein VX320_01425 [Candidatus Thermoplasmatota archaeon]|nr:hypothetical protein [Candidatus Thermoplasmatota archaeon]
MEYRKSYRSIALIAILLLSLFTPTALADPPPGPSEVVNTVCSNWNSSAGICDDYNFADDETNGQEWVQGRYEIGMVNATVMSVTMEWAVHEIGRSDVFLEDLPMGNGSDISDGIPADYLRNYFDFFTLGGMNVKEALRQEIDSSITSIIDNGFGATSGVSTQYVNQVNIDGQNLDCTDDPDVDSADEVAGLPNDAYNPPICLQTTLTISYDPANIGLTEPGMDVERAYQGLLTMGGIVTTDLNLTALPGHRATYEFIPPDYGTITSVDNDGDLIPDSANGYSFNYARWTVDNIDAVTDEWKNESSSISMVRRTTSTQAVELDLGNDKGVNVDILLDASDESASSISISMGIHHIGTDTLDEWGWDFVDNRVEVPWITSDGMRLAHSTGLADLSDLASKVPVDELNDLMDTYSPTPVTFSPFEFTPADGSGGLDFIHTPTTCNEVVTSPWCIQGPNAMNGTYPVYLSTQSNLINLDIVEIVTDLADDAGANLNGFDLSILDEEDRAAIMNAARFSGSLPSEKLTSWIPEDLPPADVTVTVLLPSWVRSSELPSDRITFQYSVGDASSQDFTITGNNPYNWQHNICVYSDSCSTDSIDLVCGTNRRTCIAVNVDIDIESLDIHEWSKTIAMEAEVDVELLIYRIGVPESALEDQDVVQIEAIPADLIRRAIHLGDEVSGGLLDAYDDELSVPVGDEDIPLEISNSGIDEFVRQVKQNFEDDLNEELDAVKSEVEEEEDSPIAISSSRIDVDASIEGLEMVPGSTLHDDRPIRIKLSANLDSLELEWVGGTMGITGAVSSLTHTVISAFSMQPRAATGDISGFEVTEGNEVEEVIEPISQDVEGELVSPALRLRLTFPRGLGFSFFDSSLQREDLSESNGRQTLTYYMPVCTSNDIEDCDEQSDNIRFGFVIGWEYIFWQLSGYIFGLLALIILLFYVRKRRKGNRKKAKLAEEEERMKRLRVKEANITGDELYGADGLPDMGAPINQIGDDGLPDMAAFGGLDKKGKIPSEDWDDILEEYNQY